MNTEIISLKEQGNKWFKEGNLANAINSYSKALQLMELQMKNDEMRTESTDHANTEEQEIAKILSNRSIAYLKDNQPQLALDDAIKVVTLFPQWIKGYYRQCSSLIALGKYEPAKNIYKQVLNNFSCNKDFDTVDKPYNKYKDFIELQDLIQKEIAISNANKLQSNADDFECVLCLKLFYEPITISCGHTFCKTCLLRARDHMNDKCPLCRVVFYISEDHAPSIVLQNIIRKTFPQKYEERKKEVEEEERLTSEELLPLFVLPAAVAFPFSPFPMHIFEPKYRLMIRRVLAGNKKFALLGTDQNNNLQLIGCCLHINEVQTLTDGRSYIRTTGTQPIKVQSYWQQDGYLVGKVDYLEDIQLSTEQEKADLIKTTNAARSQMSELMQKFNSMHCSALSKLLNEMANLLEADKKSTKNEVEKAIEFTWQLCNWAPIRTHDKQALLEMRNVKERLSKVLVDIVTILSRPHKS